MPRMSIHANIKIALVILALGIVVAVLLHTHNIVTKLQAREKKIADLYAKGIQYLGSEESSTGDVGFIFQEIINTIDFPIIMASAKNELISHKNLELTPHLPKQDSISFIYHRMEEMKKTNLPIVITYRDSIILNYIYYDESELVKKLRWLPYIEIVVAGMFIFIGYIGFSYIRKSEQSNVWVGMSRETAHQLGTPLSSLLGWIELLKSQKDEPEKISATISEMENDVNRLNKIAMRFSKIGSRPDLKDENITEVSQKVVEYYKRRIPQTDKKVEIALTSTDPVFAKINPELFEWVLENLIKNGLDAMESGVGKITLTIIRSGKNVHLDVTDTGKGIDMRFKGDIFRPGFSTKKRGWGLGLSLSKRIIENYHRGKLIVHESTVGRGTTFRIKLKV